MEETTKLLFVCGSPRKASTAYAIEEAKRGAETVADVQVDVLYLQGKKIAPCMGCNSCVKKGVARCVVYDDDMGSWNEGFFKYDGYLMGTPVYEMGMTPQLCAFLSRFRAEYLNQREDPFLRMYTPGAALAVGGTRNGGQESAINAILGFYHTQGMPVVNGGLGVYAGAAVWSQDRMTQGAAEDEKGMESARIIGKKLALTAKALKAGRPRE
ncbi:flavodoxin family protein [uncultured Oscillibacter sp.]|uniref:flavodoxin family protein n=1 Tax=uncultured Oscillibacter sp. TaxID=876091 RepID=UPI00262903BC|nr:flavodoxin family protein [uncultured Oscillibacter sp.]